jgi:hypothetical protein
VPCLRRLVAVSTEGFKLRDGGVSAVGGLSRLYLETLFVGRCFFSWVSAS